jgi:hypothetical protein
MHSHITSLIFPLAAYTNFLFAYSPASSATSPTSLFGGSVGNGYVGAFFFAYSTQECEKSLVSDFSVLSMDYLVPKFINNNNNNTFVVELI